MPLKKVFKLTAKYFPLNLVRVWALRRAEYVVGDNVYIGEDLHIAENVKYIHYGRRSSIADLAQSANTDVQGRLFIGDRVAIGPRVLIILDSDANWSKLRDVVPAVRGNVRIESDVWIGAGSILLPNITIGDASIVGAGSVVTKDVLPETIVAGNPARFLRYVTDRKQNRHTEMRMK